MRSLQRRVHGESLGRRRGGELGNGQGTVDRCTCRGDDGTRQSRRRIRHDRPDVSGPRVTLPLYAHRARGGASGPSWMEPLLGMAPGPAASKPTAAPRRRVGPGAAVSAPGRLVTKGTGSGIERGERAARLLALDPDRASTSASESRRRRPPDRSRARSDRGADCSTRAPGGVSPLVVRSPTPSTVAAELPSGAVLIWNQTVLPRPGPSSTPHSSASSLTIWSPRP